MVSTDLSNQYCCGIVGLEFDVDFIFEISDFLVGPHVADFVFLVFLEAWNIAKVGGLGGGFVQGVYYENVDPTLRTASVVFSRVGLVPCPGRVDTPLVGESGRAPSIVLVESKELPILQDRKVLVIDYVQLFGEEKEKKVSNLFGLGKKKG